MELNEIRSVQKQYRKRSLVEKSLTAPLGRRKNESSGSYALDLLTDILDIATGDEINSPGDYDKTKISYSFDISKENGIKYINRQFLIYNDDKTSKFEKAEALHKIGKLYSHPFYENRNEGRTVYYFEKAPTEFPNYKDIN